MPFSHIPDLLFILYIVLLLQMWKTGVNDELYAQNRKKLFRLKRYSS